MLPSLKVIIVLDFIFPIPFLFIRVLNCHLPLVGYFHYKQGFKDEVQLSDGSIFKIVCIGNLKRRAYV